MTDEERAAIQAQNTERADAAFNAILDYFQTRNVAANPDKEKYYIYVPARGEDLPIPLIFIIKPELEMLKISSPIPVEFPQDRFTEAAVAVNAVNDLLVGGTFSLDFSSGELFFNVTTFYADTGLSEDEIGHMTDMAIVLIDKYNDKFLALKNNLLDINTFLVKLQNGEF